MPVTRDPELEAFKTAIDLRAYAASLGYAIDKRESWRGSAVMRHGNGDRSSSRKTTTAKPALITAAVLKMPAGAEVIAAMDSDEDGARLAGEHVGY